MLHAVYLSPDHCRIFSHLYTQVKQFLFIKLCNQRNLIKDTDQNVIREVGEVLERVNNRSYKIVILFNLSYNLKWNKDNSINESCVEGKKCNKEISIVNMVKNFMFLKTVTVHKICYTQMINLHIQRVLLDYYDSVFPVVSPTVSHSPWLIS